MMAAQKEKKIDVNAYMHANTSCDRCGAIVEVTNTFLLCKECRTKYYKLLKKENLKALRTKIEALKIKFKPYADVGIITRNNVIDGILNLIDNEIKELEKKEGMK